MQFRQGMLGVAVLAVAIAGALIGSWVMSMDVEEREVTVYDPLTDITGLFDTDRAPQYTDYDPSSNYTGYWTNSTIIDGVRYFGGVDYTESSRANNFRVNEPPIDSDHGTVTLPDPQTSDIGAVRLGVYTLEDGYEGYLGTDVDCSYLSDVIQLITNKTSGTVRISSVEGVDQIDASQSVLYLDSVIFGNSGNIYRTMYNCCTQEFYDHFSDSSLRLDYYLLALSCEVNLDRGICTLYYDNDFSKRVEDVALNNCVVYYGGNAGGIFDDTLELDTVAEYNYTEFGPTTYMDPARGVRFE